MIKCGDPSCIDGMVSVEEGAGLAPCSKCRRLAMARPWENSVKAEVPEGCVPCRHCKEMCMEAEAIENDWYGRGKVIRIFSMCDVIMNIDLSKDDFRTEFDTPENARYEWNEMNSYGAHGDERGG